MGEFLSKQWWLVVDRASARSCRWSLRFARGRRVSQTLRTLDRRWIFLLMFWAVLVPIYYIGVTGDTFPGSSQRAGAARPSTRSNGSSQGDPVLLSFDYDPASEGELGPMATAFVKHAAEKKLQDVFHGAVAGRHADDRRHHRQGHQAGLPAAGVRPGLRQPRIQVGQRRRDQGHRDQPARAVHDRRQGHGAAGHPDDAAASTTFSR